MEYGKRLNKLREAKQLSIYKLSQDSGVSQGHISDLENGKYQPTIETLVYAAPKTAAARTWNRTLTDIDRTLRNPV